MINTKTYAVRMHLRFLVHLMLEVIERLSLGAHFNSCAHAKPGY